MQIWMIKNLLKISVMFKNSEWITFKWPLQCLSWQFYEEVLNSNNESIVESEQQPPTVTRIQRSLPHSHQKTSTGTQTRPVRLVSLISPLLSLQKNEGFVFSLGMHILYQYFDKMRICIKYLTFRILKKKPKEILVCTIFIVPRKTVEKGVLGMKDVYFLTLL